MTKTMSNLFGEKKNRIFLLLHKTVTCNGGSAFSPRWISVYIFKVFSPCLCASLIFASVSNCRSP